MRPLCRSICYSTFRRHPWIPASVGPSLRLPLTIIEWPQKQISIIVPKLELAVGIDGNRRQCHFVAMNCSAVNSDSSSPSHVPFLSSSNSLTAYCSIRSFHLLGQTKVFRLSSVLPYRRVIINRKSFADGVFVPFCFGFKPIDASIQNKIAKSCSRIDHGFL